MRDIHSLLPAPGGASPIRVAAMWRYPVKSMAGEELLESDISWHGLAGDRRWAFLRTDVPRSGFPWLTIRQRSNLVLYRAAFSDPQVPDRSPVLVATPGGGILDVADPALASELGPNISVIKQDRGVFDASPISLLSTGSLRQMEGLTGCSLDPRRFRPNLLLDAAGPFLEDTWVGCEIMLGGVRLRIDRPGERCMVPSIDPDTAERDAEVLRALAAQRGNHLGVYASVVTPGRVAVGDRVVAHAPWTSV